MPIIVNLDVMMAKRKMSLNELSEKVDLTPKSRNAEGDYRQLDQMDCISTLAG